MPKFEPKIIQRELDEGWVWPVYWIYGPESMKVRELLKRIRKAVVSEGGFSEMAEEKLDAADVDVSAVIDAACMMSFGGGTKFVVVRDAHLLKNVENIATLLGPRGRIGEIPSVCVLLSKDLDARKKASKLLLEKAAVIPCEEVREEDREAWIGYLAKRRGLEVPPVIATQLVSLDPWSLDVVDQELEKYALALLSVEPGVDPASALGSGVLPGGLGGARSFVEALFTRNRQEAMSRLALFAEEKEESFPLLGLLAWNARQLLVMVQDRAKGTRTVRLPPVAADQMQSWSRLWNKTELVDLQNALAQVDFELKQTPVLPLGSWHGVVSRFCR